jgi:anti-sigma regulatory factor (Ser/Thr protein kinase)
MGHFQETRPGEIIVTTSQRMLQDLFEKLKPGLEPATRAGFDTSRVYLLLDELLSNIHRHGYMGEEGRPMGVRLRLHKEYVYLAVRDLAPTFDSAHHAETRSAPPPESGQTGGMGLVIVRSMCESFTHQVPHEGGNAIYLVMKLMRRAVLAPAGARDRQTAAGRSSGE